MNPHKQNEEQHIIRDIKGTDTCYCHTKDNEFICLFDLLSANIWLGYTTVSLTLRCVQHSLWSAMCSELPTATFLFLPNWENKSINAYRALVRDNPKYCTTLGFIPKTKLTYAMPTSWKGIQRNFSNHTWSMDNIAVWNNEAKQCLTDGSPNWLQTLQRGIPEAVWEKISTSQGRTQTTSPTTFAPSTSNKKARTSLARKEAETLTSTSNHGTISSLNWSAPIGNHGHTLTEAA